MGADIASGRGAPAGADEVAERGGRLAVHHHLYVAWADTAVRAGFYAVGVVAPVGWSIPATNGEIEPARERDSIVDDDDLLMMGSR